MNIMKIRAIALFFLVAIAAHAEEAWKTVNEGFKMTMPASWKRLKVHGIDSNAGAYRGKTVDLEFDGIFGDGYTEDSSQSSIDEFKKKEADPKLLKSGEEIWHVDGNLAEFKCEKADPNKYGKRRFSNVAELGIPYSGLPGGLSVYVFYKTDKDLPTVRKVLQSIQLPYLDQIRQQIKASKTKPAPPK